MEIHLARDGQRFGPYPPDVLESYLKEGTVTSRDLAWSPQQQAWIPLKAVLAEFRKQAATAAKAVEAAKDQAQDLSAPSQSPSPPSEEEVQAAAARAARRRAQREAERERRAALLRKIRSPRVVGTAAVAVLGLAALIVLVKLPSHASISFTGEGFLRPDEGYVFVDPNDGWNWDVQWLPGMPSSTRNHTIAGAEEGTWRPAPGYAGSSADQLVWAPFQREADYPHVSAGLEPGTWITDPGYSLTDAATATAPYAEWRQGVRLLHMTSAERENYWTFDPGYTFAADSTIQHPKAAWSPGAYHPDHPHVYASPTEGSWSVDSGYRWLSASTSDLRTFSPRQTWEAWRLASVVDASMNDINCDSDSAIVAVLRAARDRYGAISTRDVHPSLAQNLAAVQTALDSGASTINTCFVVSHAKDGADILAAGLCMFSEKPWGECMEDSKTARDVVGVMGDVGTMPCGAKLQAFRQELNDLENERQRLQTGFRSEYDLQLDTPYRILTCRH